MSAMGEPRKRSGGRVGKQPSNLGLDVLRIGVTFLAAAGIALLALLIALRAGGAAVTAIALGVVCVAFLSCFGAWWIMRRGTVANRCTATIALWGALSLVLLVFMVWGGATEHGGGLQIYLWPYWARVLVALTPVIPVAGTVAALLNYLTSEPDEFQRMLTTRAVLWAMGATFVLLTGWSFLSMYVDAPPIPAPLVMAAFWIAFAIAGPIVRWQYR